VRERKVTQSEANHSTLRGKCELVGRGADGAPVTEAAVDAAGVAIDGHSLVPLAHSTPIRYLGVHCCFDGDWSAQQRKLLATIQLFTRLVNKFRLSVSQAAYSYICNTFLLPKLELRLRYIHGPQAAAWIKSYDRTLVASIEHMVSSPVRLSHSAVALAAGFLLPSWFEVAIKVSELFLRMNGSTDCRWGHTGRQLMRQQVGPTMDKHFDRRKNTDSGTRLQRAAAHAVNRLSWRMQFRDEPSRRSRISLPESQQAYCLAWMSRRVQMVCCSTPRLERACIWCMIVAWTG
jgi:hypothetical protein